MGTLERKWGPMWLQCICVQSMTAQLLLSQRLWWWSQVCWQLLHRPRPDSPLRTRDAQTCCGGLLHHHHHHQQHHHHWHHTIVQVGLQISELRELTGRQEPTVITWETFNQMMKGGIWQHVKKYHSWNKLSWWCWPVDFTISNQYKASVQSW